MHIKYVFLPIFTLLSSVFGADFDYDGWVQLRLWHSLKNSAHPNFIERGNVTISSTRFGTSNVAQIGLSQQQIQKLKILAENNFQYLLKVNVKTSRGSEMTFLTSIPACHLLGSDLEDALHVWLDGGAEVVAVNLVTPGLCSTQEPFAKMWTTDVRVKYPEAGPVPDTTSYIQKLDREKEAKERGETKDNRSFFAKYWMYIVPGIIIVVLSSAANPEAGANGAAGAAQRQ